MLFGVRASRLGTYIQQAQTAKRFAKDRVSCGFHIHPSGCHQRGKKCVYRSKTAGIADFSSTREHLPPHRPFTHTRSIPTEYLGEPKPRYQLGRVKGGGRKERRGGVGGGFLAQPFTSSPLLRCPLEGAESTELQKQGGSVSEAVPKALPPHPSIALLPSRGSRAVHRRCVKRKLSP